jgi:alpha-D-xyloside xylohydrolase
VTVSSRFLRPVLASLAILCATPALAAEGSFQRTADGIVVTPAAGPAKRVRLQVMSDRIIHVTATPAADTKVPASLMVVAKPQPPAALKVEQAPGRVILKAGRASAEVSLADGTVRFRDAADKPVLAGRDAGAFTPVKVEGRDFYRVRQQFNPGTDEAFYGLGQHQNGQMDYNGEDVELSQYNRVIAVPFLLSSRGYGLLWDNNSITRFGNPAPYGLASRDLKIFDAAGKPGGFTARYYVGGELKLTRTEADIDYQHLKDLVTWPAELSTKKPDPQQHASWGAARVVWEGSVETPLAGVHKFQLYSSGYAKLYLDGKLVIDRWRQNWNPWFHNFEAPLTPGKRHTVRVEWTPDDGYIALLHNNPMPAADRHSLQLTSEVGQAIDYYFIAGGDLDDVVAGYRQLTGKAVLAPRWAYGFWQSRQRYETADQILSVLKEYRTRNLPLDNVVMDWRYWKDPEWGSHRFDETRFPDPKGMIDQIHAQHAHFMISVWPKFYPTTEHFKELDKAGFMYHRNLDQGAVDWVGPGYANSFYNPYTKAARDIYWRQIKESLKGFGVDAWWLDASEPDMHSNLDVPERTLRMSPTALGPGAEYFNSYSLPHTEGVYEGELAGAPDVRPFILTRSGFAGLQRNGAAVWSGDVVARWDDLRDQISAGVNLSMSGIPNWTTDIGGFSVEKRYESQDPAHVEEWRELNLRWFQFGAFSPVFRSHGEAPYREIYNLAPEGSEVYRALAWYDELRYRLMPYVYTTAADTYHHDGSIMRGLVMDFPADPAARKVNDEYLFGRSFLVAPVTQFKARTRSVYLPTGATWYDFESGKAYVGGGNIEAPAPLARMPLFVKAGAIVPMGPVQQYVGEKPDAPITLVVFTGRDGRFELYEDDGLSNGYQRGAYSRIPIAWNDATGRLTIGARSGSFKGMVERRTFRVRFIRDGVRPTDFDVADATVDYAGQLVTVARKH